MVFKKNKKGELTTQQIILLIILIASFIVILFLLFRLNLGKETDSELCHNSVVLRGSSVVPADATPLKCSRAYVCLSEDGNCDNLKNMDVIKVKTKEEVYQNLAEQMANCWWMFGEGKVNYVGTDFKSNLYCSICSQVYLDSSLNNINGIDNKIDQKDFFTYLQDTKTPNGESSYLNYLEGVNSVNVMENSLSQNGGSFGSYDLKNYYYVMMGIYSDVGVWKWVGGAAIAAGIIAAPFTAGASLGVSALFIGGSAVAGGIAGNYIGTAVKGDSGYDFLRPVILKANSDSFNAFQCKDISTLA